MRVFHRDTDFLNSVHIRGEDGTDPQQATKATQKGRRRCRQLAKFLVDCVPGFECACVSELGQPVGVRETCKLSAERRDLARDLAAAKKFADGILCCDNLIDDVMRSDAAMTHDSVAQGSYYITLF